MLTSIYSATVPLSGGDGDWWTYLGPFIPAAMLGLAVIMWLVRRLDSSQAESKALTERLIAQNEALAPLLRDAISLIGLQGDLIAEQGDLLNESKIEVRLAREERERRGRT